VHWKYWITSYELRIAFQYFALRGDKVKINSRRKSTAFCNIGLHPVVSAVLQTAPSQQGLGSMDLHPVVNRGL